MIQYSYEEIIKGINNRQIKLVRFCVNDYAHYKDCVIVNTELKLYNGRSIPQIEVILTKDSEKTYFLEKFIENTKLFNMGKKGRFTLKEMWKKITVLEVINN